MRKSIVVTFLLVSVVFSDTKLEPTVISTSGFEQDISKEIRNVIVITKDDIVKKGYKNIGDVLKNTPGVSFKPTATAMGSIIDMRGTGANANTKVKVMIDDVTMNMLDSSHTAVATDTISIDDIERIEIIPGGGAVLYGNGTQGGVVNIITKTKASKPYANIYTKYGSNSYNDLRLNTGGNINDKLFVKGSFNIYDSDGYRQYEKSKGKYGSVGLSYDFLDIHSFDIGASFFSGEADYAGSVSKEKLKENRRYSNKDDISKFKTNRKHNS